MLRPRCGADRRHLQMARLLQNRLELASIKTKHGWENLNLDALEPRLERELKRKRSSQSLEALSDSDEPEHYLDAMQTTSESITAPLFSDDMFDAMAGSDFLNRSVTMSDLHQPRLQPGPRKRARANSAVGPRTQAPEKSWANRHLSQSSPVYHRRHARLPVSRGAHLSFISEATTFPHGLSSPVLPASSDDDDSEYDQDDDQDLPTHSFNMTSPYRSRNMAPRTPPNSRARKTGFYNVDTHPIVIRRQPRDEGAEALLSLAASPSPAYPQLRHRVYQPSTPPSRHTALPSSMMTTPNGGNMLPGFAIPNTPAPKFNMADFVNITPSPAQAAWAGRTPKTARSSPPARVKTPPAAKEARRRLNSDGLLPAVDSASQSDSSDDEDGKGRGLGMELGGELVPGGRIGSL